MLPDGTVSQNIDQERVDQGFAYGAVTNLSMTFLSRTVRLMVQNKLLG
jgi:hypothetical protein